MTTAIYVTSTQRFSGKTALCLGLIRWFQRKGLSAGYMKPISTTARIRDEKFADEDAIFIKSVLEMPDSLETIVPLMLTEREVDGVLRDEAGKELGSKALDAFRNIEKGRGAVVMEGGTSLREGFIINLDPPRLSKLLGARALVVVPYTDTLQVVDDILAAQSLIEDNLLGAVINQVPQHRVALMQEKVKPFVESRGIPIFAILQREKALMSVSVGELVEGLGGDVLCCQAAMGELVENLMVGAMSAEGALTYFRRAPNKVVVTGGDRADIQLAALETSTRCLVLTGNLRPNQLIVALAEERNVPIVLTRNDTLKTVEILESYFGKTRFHQQKKVQHFEKLLGKSMDFDAFGKALGLK
jgi:BioD-like phosphotransacetylase family protein